MELKYIKQAIKRRHHESSNRTFMELKYRMRHFSATEGVCSNRTFMELKYIWRNGNGMTLAVLIVPLWN